MNIGANIQLFRKKAGYTQRELAEKCGLATGTIQQYELGKRQPRLEQLQKIADTLNVNISELMGLNELFSSQDAIIHACMTNDLQYTELFKTWTKLNSAGREKATERVKELTEIKKYTEEIKNYNEFVKDKTPEYWNNLKNQLDLIEKEKRKNNPRNI